MKGLFDRVTNVERTLNRAETDHVIGIVSDRRNDKQWGPVARFTIPDQDNKVTGWISVGQKSCVGTAEYFLPRIGERMLIQKLGNGPEDAVATHALYSTSVSAPPQSSIDNDHKTFDDGSTLTVAPGTGMHLVATNALTLDVDGATTFNANGTITISVGGTFQVTAPSINLNGVIIDSSGNVTIPGTLTVNGFTSCKGGGTTTPHMTNADGLSTNSC
jgi:phage baseplate assembly protein V